METRSVFAVRCSSTERQQQSKTIIGMTVDGFPDNLEYIERCFYNAANDLNCLTKIRNRDEKTIIIILNNIVRNHKGWLFIDDIDNEMWVSHSIIIDPKTRSLVHLYFTKPNIYINYFDKENYNNDYS